MSEPDCRFSLAFCTRSGSYGTNQMSHHLFWSWTGNWIPASDAFLPWGNSSLLQKVSVRCRHIGLVSYEFYIEHGIGPFNHRNFSRTNFNHFIVLRPSKAISDNPVGNPSIRLLSTFSIYMTFRWLRAILSESPIDPLRTSTRNSSFYVSKAHNLDVVSRSDPTPAKAQ
jgi:hypothetical protein